MKKLLVYLVSFIALFVIAFGLYNQMTGEIEEEVLTESIAIDSKDEEISEQTISSEPAEAILDTHPKSELKMGWQGPETTYLDEAGIEHSLSNNEGKPTLINIWATWCPPCRDEMPLFDDSYALYGDQVNFIMLNALNSRPTETQERALEFVDDMDLSFPIYFDQDSNNQIEFIANMLPLTVLLDSKGEIIETVRGQVSPAKLKQLLGKVIEVS